MLDQTAVGIGAVFRLRVITGMRGEVIVNGQRLFIVGCMFRNIFADCFCRIQQLLILVFAFVLLGLRRDFQLDIRDAAVGLRSTPARKPEYLRMIGVDLLTDF